MDTPDPDSPRVDISRLHRYRNPHLKQLVMNDRLYMQSWLRNDENAKLAANRIVEILDEMSFEWQANKATGCARLQYVLMILWDMPDQGFREDVTEDDYRNLYTALVDDDMDVSRLPHPNMGEAAFDPTQLPIFFWMRP